MTKQRIAVIGFGAAAIGFLTAMKNNPNYDIDVYDKGLDLMSSSLSGIRSDGKLFVTDDTDLDIDIPMRDQYTARDIYLNACPRVVELEPLMDGSIGINKGHGYKTYHSFSDQSEYMEFYKAGFKPVKAEYIHLGTDTLKSIVPFIHKDLALSDNIHFKFDCNVSGIEKEIRFGGPSTIQIFVNEHPVPREYSKVIVACGRSGYELIKSFDDKYRIINGHARVDIGVRMELPNIIVDRFNNNNYEWKVRYRTKTGYTGRTFCNNPAGWVVQERHKDLVTVNGHSFDDQSKKSDNTNFAILISTELTTPFQDPNSYGYNIAKISNQLGDGKILCQTVGDFIHYKRTKQIGRVKPTLNANEMTLGDLNLAFPAKIRESIVDFLSALGRVERGIMQCDNLLYGMEMKFYSNKMVDELDNIHFIGDCSGHTRSICHATAHGMIVANKILNKEK